MSDGTAAPNARAGAIEHRSWPDPPLDAPTGPQLPAYQHAAASVRTGWLCLLDADEFLHLEDVDTAAEFVEIAARPGRHPRRGSARAHPAFVTVDATGRPVMVEDCTFVGPPRWLGAWVNHDFVQSREEFETKRRRGKATHPASAPDQYDHDHAGYFEPYNRNEEEDRTIQRVRPRLAAKLARLHNIACGSPDRLDSNVML